MAGRASAFADPDIVKMATDDYVAVACDDWYQRRRQDAEGEFFRKVAEQGPRKGQGGFTRQGIYCLTADGKLLIYKNAGQDSDVMRDVFRRGLAEWRKLPAHRREAGAMKIEELPRTDPHYVRTPPKDGLVLRVASRLLDREKDGTYRDADCGGKPGDAPAMDHMWITRQEVQSLAAAARTPAAARSRASAPQSFDMPATITERLLRFHLTDNTRGEPPMWRRGDIRCSQLALTAVEGDGPRMTLRLEGSALLATAADTAKAEPGKADRGYDVRLLGEIRLDASSGRITRFDVVAVGDHWGEGTFTRGARPGRTPLGVALELADGRHPGDSVPPQGAREVQEYFGAAYRR